MKKSFYINCGVIIVSIAVLISACSLPLPRCEPEGLMAPIDLSPNGLSPVVDPTTPLTLYWGYPDTACAPDRFEAFVWTGIEPAAPGITGWAGLISTAPPYRVHGACPGQSHWNPGTLMTGGSTLAWRPVPDRMLMDQMPTVILGLARSAQAMICCRLICSARLTGRSSMIRR